MTKLTDYSDHDASKAMPTRFHYDTESLPRDDEISLFDIWDALVRRRWLIVSVTIVVTALALGYTLTMEKSYRYSQVIDIGTRIANNQWQPIETPASAAAKLNEHFIPAAIRKWLDDQAGSEAQPSVTASAPRDAGIVILEAQASDQRAQAVTEILTSATGMLLKDHDRAFVAIRAQLAAEVERARSEVEALRAEEERLRTRLAGLDRSEDLIHDEISRVEQELAATQERRRDLLDGSKTNADPIQGLIVSDQIQQLENTIRQLRRELIVSIPEKRGEYRRELQDTQRQLKENNAKLQAAESQLKHLAKSRVTEPQRSINPVGKSETVIVGSGVVLGAILGVFAAFAMEFAAAARRRRESREQLMIAE